MKMRIPFLLVGQVTTKKKTIMCRMTITAIPTMHRDSAQDGTIGMRFQKRFPMTLKDKL